MSLAGRLGVAAARGARALAAAALGLSTLALLGGAALAWQLSRGPVDAGWLARGVEAAANRADGPTRLHVDGASLAWDGFHGGPGRPLELRLSGIRATDAGGAAAEVNKVAVTLSIHGLVAGEVTPGSVEIEGARLQVLRAAGGALGLGTRSLDAPPDSDATPNAAAPLPRLLADLAGGRDDDPILPGVRLRELRRVVIRDARIEVADRQLGATWRVAAAEIDLRRLDGGDLSGMAEVALALGEVEARLTARAAREEDGAARIEAALTPVVPAELARAAPAFGKLAALDAAVTLAGTLDLSPELAPLRATVRATTGAGRLRAAGMAVELRSAGAEVEAAWDGPVLRELRLTGVQAVLPMPGAAPAMLTASGTARLGDGALAADMAAEVDQVPFAELGRLWPEDLARNARTWVVGNITDGTARAARVKLSLAGAPDLSTLKLNEVDAQLRGDDVTIHWLRPVPPVERVQATLRVTAPDAIDIAASSGRQGPLALRRGTVRIGGLRGDVSDIAINLDVAGTVPDALTLLQHPRLKLLDRQKTLLRDTAGTMEAHVLLRLPLLSDIPADQFDVRATAHAEGLRLPGIAGGRDVERGSVQLEATQDGLKATGPATVGGIPAQLAVELDFRRGPPGQVVQRITGTGRATARQLGAADLDADWVMQGGQLGLDVGYTARRDGQAELRVRADLRDAELAGLGWTKAPGVAGQASARLALRDGRLVGVEEIRAEAPGLRVEGRADIPGGKLSLLLLDRIELGRTRAAGEVRLAARRGEPIRAVVSGPVLDLSTLLAQAGPTTKEDDLGAAWHADVVFDRVLMSGGEEAFSDVAASVRSDGARIRFASVETGGPVLLRARIKPQGGGRAVSVRAADAGALLRALGVTDTVLGGRLALAGRFNDAARGSPLSGTAELEHFGVRQAQTVGKVLQGLTLYGLVDALRGPGLVFDRLTLPFRHEGGVLSLNDAQASSSSLGVTAKGRIDLARKLADIEGTIVPAYVLNAALGRLPLVGRLFSPEQGGGVLSVAYTVRGKLDDPAVIVNPLTALTPGFLRGLFKAFN